MDNNKQVIFKAKNITKRFPGVRALDEVDFELYKGEIHTLLGENGSGKSTLMKIMFGIYTPDEGEMEFNDKPYKLHKPKDALDSGVCMIHQEISLVSTMSVSENIWLGREHLFKSNGLISIKKRLDATKELLDDIGININPNEMISNLSVANMQLVEIARAVSYNAQIIIMDEPTSALTDVEVKLLYKIMRQLKSDNKTIVFISHKLEEIFEISDRITILRDGKYIATKYCNKISKDELISLVVGRELTDLFEKEKVTIGKSILEIKNLSSIGQFKDINFDLKEGEILGVCGLMGAGRTELMNAIFAIDKYNQGEILLNGKKVNFKSPKDAIKNGIGMVTEDRLNRGIIAGLSVKINASIAALFTLLKLNCFINLKEEQKKTLDIIKLLNVKVSSLGVDISTLSGGNQQKVLIGRCLLNNPKIIILDEPTRGIDIGAKREIYQYMNMLVKKGISIILVSSELPEILAMSDRILVMREGRISNIFDASCVDQTTLISSAFGA